jgi:hypothetical protein
VRITLKPRNERPSRRNCCKTPANNEVYTAKRRQRRSRVPAGRASSSSSSCQSSQNSNRLHFVTCRIPSRKDERRIMSLDHNEGRFPPSTAARAYDMVD